MEQLPDEITISWCIDDVKEIAPDLTDDQCRKVLALAKRKHDAEIGINWDVLRVWVDYVLEQEAD